MIGKLFKSSGKCKTCFSRLSDDTAKIGFCQLCAAKEAKKLKKRIYISSIIGIVLAAIIFSAIFYAKSSASISTAQPFAGSILVPVFSGHLILNPVAFKAMTEFTPVGYIMLATFCFTLPFSSRVNLEPGSIRDKSQSSLYKVDTLVSYQSSLQSYHKFDDIGLFIISIIFMVVSGPFFFVYKLYKFAQISKYLRYAEATPAK